MKEIYVGVSGNIVKRVSSRAEAFEYLMKWYNIGTDEEFAAFHCNIPHNETNHWPT
jgi:hypothetical protein